MMDVNVQGAFLVTCVGAYNDSGLGTGGFVCIRNGESVIVDKMDSTGLLMHENLVYRFVRSLKSMVLYDQGGIRIIFKPDLARDVHDIMFHNGNYVLVSTGTNSIYWYDQLGNVVRVWQAEGTDDAWHLNCLCEANGKLYVSAFGEYETHRAWVDGCNGKGFIMDLETGDKVVTGLSGPHNPRFIDGQWVVCNSHTRSVSIHGQDGSEKTIQLNGFTRGLAYDEQCLYIGESADRKAVDPVEHSYITVVDRKSLAFVGRILVPFPEIYEIAIIPDEFAEKMVNNQNEFMFDAESERIKSLEEQVEISRRENQQMRHILGDPLKYSSFLRRKIISRLMK